MHFARRAAADGLLNGWKSVELSQAYILLSTYAVPARRWEEDRSWLYIGLAIRCVVMEFLSHVYSCEIQHRDGSQPAPDLHDQTQVRQAEARIVEPGAPVADMSQPRSLDGHAVRQAVDNQGGLVRPETRFIPVLEAHGIPVV